MDRLRAYDCQAARGAILGHHLGCCEEDERERLDAHLLTCQECLRGYLAVKRAAEALPAELGDGGPRPSEALRLRLRADVARSFQPTPLRRLGRALARPVPLYQAAAVALVVVLGGLLTLWLRPAPSPGQEAVAWPEALEPLPARAPAPRRPARGASPPAREVIDTSRPEAESLHIL